MSSAAPANDSNAGALAARRWRAWLGPLAVKAQRRLAAAAALCALLGACAGSNERWTTNGLQPPAQGPRVTPLRAVPDGPAPSGASAAAAPTPSVTVPLAIGRPDAGVLLLLLPDNQSVDDPRVHAWLDAASEEGVRLQAITDARFLQLGRTASEYAGLILPDSLHTHASDGLIAAITAYTQNGGHTMLVYDFGALTQKNGVSFYPVPKSRMSALAGVDYVLYDALRAKTTGLGPVRAQRSTLRELLVPPGKSMPYAALAPPSVSNSGGVSSQSALYLPVSPQDPGGSKGFDPQQFVAVTPPSLGTSLAPSQGAQRTVVDFGSSFKMAAVPGVTELASRRQALSYASVPDGTVATLYEPLHAYSGYLLGNLIYPTYVTQGNFGWPSNPKQIALADSPQFGLVAGVNPVGLGQVLFVNLPLTYLKGRTDALMMHGFLHYFSRNLLNMPYLSAMPNGVAGLTFDWHLDFLEAQEPTQALMAMNVFNDPAALFSIEMTAGPDTIDVGDRLGWNLPANPTAQNILSTLDKLGHSVGSHGGWIHDYIGSNVTETNQLASSGGACVNRATQIDNFEQCYVLNRQAVDSAIGRASRGYSAPLGNTPPWAMDWLEARGVVAAYFAGHTGLGATRHYRDGQLLNPKVWVFPVTPAGAYATFEEWQRHKVPKAQINQWYRELIDFSIAQNTSRMVYAHPPGAYLWRDVLRNLLQYAATQQRAGNLNWYTMTRLADFMTTRLDVRWSESVEAGGTTRFDAFHPSSLNEMAWRLPKSKYASAPQVVSGNATVDSQDASYWRVAAGPGQRLVFTAKPSQR